MWRRQIRVRQQSEACTAERKTEGLMEEEVMGKRTNYAIVGAILTVIFGVTLIARAAVTDGIAGWWLFNESYPGVVAQDSSGGGNNGTLISTAYFTNDAERGNVLFVDGASGEVEIPFSSRLEPKEGTISVWVKPTNYGLADIVRQPTDLLITCGRPGTLYAYGLRIDKKGAPVAILANDDPKTCNRKPQTVLTGPARTVKPGQWTHLVMRWDGSTLSLFANGKSAGSTAYNANPDLGLSYHGTDNLKVAAALWDMNDGYLEYFGSISDLRIFSRALTDSEVQDIFNGQ
jgi:hypothetical protein